MKRFVLTTLLAGTSPIYAQLPVSESFLSDGEGSRYFSNAAGSGSDFFQRVTSAQPNNFGSAILGFDGAMWAFEDVGSAITGTPNDGVVTLKTIAGAGAFANRQVVIKIADARAGQNRPENNDQILIQYAFDGNISESGVPGSGNYTTIGRFVGDNPDPIGGGDLREDKDLDGVSTDSDGGAAVTQTLSDFTFDIPNGGNNLSVRIVCDMTGGTEEFAFDDIRVTGVTATTETPVLANIEGSATTFTEGGSAVQITNSLNISDTDSSQLTGATVSITSNFDQSEDVLLFTNQNGISGTYISGTGILTLTGASSLANYRTALRSVTYDNTDNVDAIMATRTISFKVTDDQSNTSLAATRDVDVNTSLNPPAVLQIAGYCESFETNGEGARYGSNYATIGGSDFFARSSVSSLPSDYVGAVSGPGLDGSFAWVSEDTVTATGGTGMVTLAPLTVSGFTSLNVSLALEQGRFGDPDQWENTDFVKVSYSMDGGPFEVVGAFYGDDSNGINGLLREDANLNGVSGDSDGGAEVPSDLTDFTFAIPATGNTLQIRVEVRTNGSEEIAFDNICINGSTTTNSPPVLAAIESGTIGYAEGSPAVGITSTLTIADSDDTDLESAKVEFTGAFSQSQDQLVFTDQNGISGSYDNSAGELTLTGTASLANYQAALRSVEYVNSEANDAAPGTRTVRFSVNDGDSGSNLDQTRDIIVSTTLDSPIALTSSGYCESFETDGAGTRYASNHASDGAGDVFERFNIGALPTGYPGSISGDLDGNFVWVVEDTTGTVGGEGTIDLRTQIVTGWDDLEVSFALGNGRSGENRFESDDYVRVGYSMDGGPFTVIGAFYGNNPSAAGRLVQDVNLNGASGDDAGVEVPAALTTYNFSIPVTGDQLVVGVRVSSAGTEEIAFDNICISGTDTQAPTLALANPANGASVTGVVLNAQGYLDVTISDNVGLDAASITDAGQEFLLTGTAAAGVTVNGAGVDQGNDVYRYSFTGSFGPGLVGVAFQAGGVLDDSSNPSAALSQSFTVTNTAPVLSTLSQDIDEDVSVTFTETAFDGGFSDADLPDSLATLRITSLPTTGTLVRSSGGGVILVGDLPEDIPRNEIAGLTYVPQPNFAGPTDSFGWNASDGTDFAATSTTYTFNLTEVNDDPVAGPDVVSRFPSSSVKISVASLLANDSDPGDTPPDLPLTLESVNYTGGNGATLSLVGDTIFYDPNGYEGDDTFTYVLRDARGGIANASPVTIDAIGENDPQLNAAGKNLAIAIDAGQATILGAGIPGRTYLIQVRDTNNPNAWVNLPGGTVTADPATGVITFTDPGPLPPMRIYRTIQQQTIQPD